MTKEEINLLVKTLFRISFFSACSSGDIDIILGKFNKYSFSKGKVIIRANKPGKFFSVIYKGKVAVIKKQLYFRKKILTTLSAGDYFGEVSLISDKLTTATVKAVEETEIFILNKYDFQQILKQNSELNVKIQSVAEKRKLESQF